MMDDLFNNVNVWHNGRKISIAQHFDCPSSRQNGEPAVQEVGIIPDDGDWSSMHIKKYGSTLTHLIEVLEGIRDEIDQKEYNESSGESYARTAQITTGSAT